MIVDAITSQWTVAANSSQCQIIYGNDSKVIQRITVASSVSVKVFLELALWTV